MWTLAEQSKIETDVLRKSIIDTLIMESNLMEIVPWETIGQLSTGVIRVKDLPSVGFRRINGAYSSTDIGHLEHKFENIALFGRDIDTDEALARAKNTIAEPRALQQGMVLKAMAYSFNDTFINGKIDADNPLTWEGLKQRVEYIVAEGFTGQKIDAACGGVGILNTSATMHAFLDKLEKLRYSIKGHKPDFYLMNSDMLHAVTSLLRREKLLDVTKDIFEREIETYKGARLVDIGTKADQLTQIITSTEDSSGDPGSSEHTSVYACKFGVGELTWGIQQFPLEATDLSKGGRTIDEKPVYRTRVTWNLGLATADPRSLSRMYGIIPDASS